MKQGNPTKKFGLVALIGAMISGLVERPKGVTVEELAYRKNMVLTNGGRSPIPSKFLNQRQRRKLARQQPHGKI